jgi:hypothetical protein
MLEDEADLWDSWIAMVGLEEKTGFKAAAVWVDIMMLFVVAS